MPSRVARIVTARLTAVARDGVLAYFVLSALLKLLPVVFADAWPLDSDEAVLGLMARHLSQGRFALFSYGQTYGGGIEYLLGGTLACVVPDALVAVRLAVATLTWVTEVLFFCALAPAIPRRLPRLAACALLAVGGMTYAREFSHSYGVHLNNAFLFAVLLLWIARSRGPGFFLGACVGVGYWVSPYVWLLLVCVVLAHVAIRRAPARPILPEVAWAVLGFAIGGLPRVIYDYAPDAWYAPYRGGGFALVRASAIPGRVWTLATSTLPDYFFGDVRRLGLVGGLVALVAFLVAIGLLVVALRRVYRDVRAGDPNAVVPASMFLLAGASLVVVVINRRVYDSGYRYLWPVQIALAAAWAMAVDRELQSPALPSNGRSHALGRFRLALPAIPFVVGTLALLLAQHREGLANGAKLRRQIAEQAIAKGCQVGVADYWYGYSLAVLTGERLRLNPIYTSRLADYANDAALARLSGKRTCAVFDLSNRAQSTETNRILYRRMKPDATYEYAFPGDIRLLVMGTR